MLFIAAICRADSPSDDEDDAIERAHDRAMRDALVIRCHDEIKEVGIRPDGHKILKLFRTYCRWEKLIKDE